MEDGPRAFDVPGAWVGADELPVHFANAFVALVGPNAIFLNVGASVPPNISGDTIEEQERQVAAIQFVPIKPVVRLALTPVGLDELIALLEETRNNYAALRKALEDKKGEQ